MYQVSVIILLTNCLMHPYSVNAYRIFSTQMLCVVSNGKNLSVARKLRSLNNN